MIKGVSRMAVYKLGDIVPIKQGIVENNDAYWILNLDMVESNTGRIIDYVYEEKKKIGSSTVTFDTNNVLYSKLRPYLNKVVIPDRSGYATSEMLPLCPQKDIITREYLTYFLRSPHFVAYINEKTSGAKMPRANISDLKAVEINCPIIEEQKRITFVFDRIADIISARQRQLQKLDELVKARFVEMFGDPLFNSLGLKTLPMTEVCEIIDGDRGKNYPTADEFSDEGYCLFLNAKNVTASGFNFDNCIYITKEKDEALRKGRLSRGDVVLTTRGTLGNLAFYTDEVPFEHVRINSGMVILRMKKDIIDEPFFIEQFRMQLNDIKVKIASGSAQPQLPISTMNKIQVIIPDIDRQRQFATFVKQLDKTKSAVQAALDKAQTLFDSLMQKYFG